MLKGSELVPVPFHGDTILATRLPDGKVGVSVKRVCESLGLNYETQFRKLKSTNWACIVIMTMHDTTGRQQNACVIPIDSLPMWMATISPSRVSPEIAEKLLAFQTEARDVLANHFLPKAPPAEEGSLAARRSASEAQLRALLLVYEQQAEQERQLQAVTVQVTSVKGQIAEAKAIAEAALAGASGDTGFVSILGFCRLKGLRLSGPEMATIGKALKKECVERGLPTKKRPDERWGEVLAYPKEILEEWGDRYRRRLGISE